MLISTISSWNWYVEWYNRPENHTQVGFYDEKDVLTLSLALLSMNLSLPVLIAIIPVIDSNEYFIDSRARPSIKTPFS